MEKAIDHVTSWPVWYGFRGHPAPGDRLDGDQWDGDPLDLLQSSQLTADWPIDMSETIFYEIPVAGWTDGSTAFDLLFRTANGRRLAEQHQIAWIQLTEVNGHTDDPKAVEMASYQFEEHATGWFAEEGQATLWAIPSEELELFQRIAAAYKCGLYIKTLPAPQ